MSPQSQPEVVVRTATPIDAPLCGQICYDAFSGINAAHGFPCDFPNPAAATGLLSMMFSNEGFYCVIGEINGRVAGSNCLDERSIIAGVGPITIDPGVQNCGIARGAVGVRLVQAAFHNRSLSLYARLGFDVRDSLLCLQGRTTERSLPGCAVRPGQPADVDAWNQLSMRVHGFARATELAQAIQQNTALIVERGGRITDPNLLRRFSTAKSWRKLQALIGCGNSGSRLPTLN